MAAKSRYEKSPKIAKKESDAPKEAVKPGKSGDAPKGEEKVEHKTPGSAPKGSAATGTEESGIPVHEDMSERHSAERHEMGKRQSREMKEMHARHADEHAAMGKRHSEEMAGTPAAAAEAEE